MVEKTLMVDKTPYITDGPRVYIMTTARRILCSHRVNGSSKGKLLDPAPLHLSAAGDTRDKISKHVLWSRREPSTVNRRSLTPNEQEWPPDLFLFLTDCRLAPAQSIRLAGACLLHI